MLVHDMTLQRCTRTCWTTGIPGSFFPILLFLCLTRCKSSITSWLIHIFHNSIWTTEFLSFQSFFTGNHPQQYYWSKDSWKDQNAYCLLWSTQHGLSEQLHCLNHLNNSQWLCPGPYFACTHSQHPSMFEKPVLLILCIIISTLVFPIVK